MAHFAAANRAPYQTYARPLAGEKRKRASKSNQPESIQRNDTPTAARSKKIRSNKDKYNAKYMAEMCFSAYKARLNTAGFEQYTTDVANDWREDLVEMFTHAAIKGTIKQDAAARHVVPRLVLLVPRTNEKKDEFVKDFAKHYENVRCDMMVIGKIMDSGCQIDDHSISEVRECLYGLHNALAKGVKWRNIMPYTPLPLYHLQTLRDLIKYSRPYQILGDLVVNIDDIEGWLTSPPVSLDLPTGLIDEVVDTLRAVTEDKIAKTSIGPHTQQMAEYREQKAERRCLEKEEQARQQEHAHLERVQRIEAEQEQMKQKIKSLELAAANERAQERVRRCSEAAAIAEREKSYQNQITRNTTEIGRLSTDLAKLAARQSEKTKPEVTSTPLLPVGSAQLSTSMGSSFSRNQTTSSSDYQPQSSLGTSFGSSMGGNTYGQPGPFGQTLCQPTLEDDDAPMADAQGVGTPQKYPTSFGPTGLSDPERRGAWQSNPFATHISNGVPSQPLGSSDGNFKAACPAYKDGSCTLGRDCRLPHAACKFWLNGNCKYGGRCYGSHDPFFREEAASRGQPRLFLQPDQLVIDSDPTLRSSPFPQANPFAGRPIFQHEEQNRTHNSQLSNSMNLFGHQAPPTGPRERASIMNRMTKDGQPILSQGSKTASNYDGNAFDQQALPTGPRGDNVPGCQAPSTSSRERNAFFNKVTNNNQPISSKGPVFASTKDSIAFSQRGILADVVQGPHEKAASKKVACKHNLKGKCNKGDSCQYAHQPCPRFLDGTCRHGNGQCKKSHDHAFLDRGPSNNGVQRSMQSPPRHQPPQNCIEQSLDEMIQTAGRGRKDTHGKPPRVEQSLNDIIRTGRRDKKEKPGKPSQSEIPCRWQTTSPSGCTNNSCPYKHDPPKASRGAWNLPNLWGSVGNILRGNR